MLPHGKLVSRDRRAAAELLARILGVPWAESGVGPFCPVYVNEGLRAALTDIPHMSLYAIYPALLAFSVMFLTIGIRAFRGRVLS